MIVACLSVGTHFSRKSVHNNKHAPIMNLRWEEQVRR